MQLGAGHPGVRDEAYRERRNALAALALDWRPGEPPPTADYTEEEHEVWRVVSRELAPSTSATRVRSSWPAVPGCGCRPTGSRSWPRSALRWSR